MPVETSPYTVDPQVVTRFDQRQTVFGRREHDAEASFYRRGTDGAAVARIDQNEAGYSRLEWARMRAAWTVSDHFREAYSWQRLGATDPVLGQLGRYPVSDPGQMSAVVKETAHTYGASTVGICALDRRWVYSHDMDGREIEIPSDMGYAIVMAVAMDQGAIQTSPAFAAGTATGVGYSRMAFCAACVAQFVRHLGYRAISSGNDTALSIPLAIDAGLGELGRNGLLIAPERGPCVRLCKVLTDMPLVPDRSVSFGAGEVCGRCRRCAEACEAGAIQFDPEPSFRAACRSNRQGIRRWAVDADRCYGFWVKNGASCSTCIAVCPFTWRKPSTGS